MNAYEECENQNVTREAFYLLDVLSAFINDREPSPPPKEFDALAFARLVARNDVAPIAARVCLRRPEYFERDLLERLRREHDRALGIELAQQTEIESICRAFDAAKIRYMPLKGAVMKTYYPDPYLRTSRDFDILVEESGTSDARVVLKGLGYSFLSGDEHHDRFIKRPCFLVELHRKLFAAFGAYKSSRTVDWARLLPADASNERSFEYRFSTEDFYRYMMEHLLKHWLQSDLPTRFFVDVAIYLRRFGDELDRAKLDAEFKQSGAFEFVQTIERMTRVWFDGAPGDPVVDEATLYALRVHELNRARRSSGKLILSAEMRPGGNGVVRFARFCLRRLLAPTSSPDAPARDDWKTSTRVWRRICRVTRLLFRASSYKRLALFWRSTPSRSVNDSIVAFQRRMGIRAENINADDWDC